MNKHKKISLFLATVAIAATSAFASNDETMSDIYIMPQNNEAISTPVATNRYGLDFTKAAESTINSVVSIKSFATRKQQQYYGNDFVDPFEFFFGPGFGGQQRKQQQQQQQQKSEPQPIGSGSGVIISEDGYIVTNNHVIDGAEKLEVTLNDNRKFNARVIGTDPNTDVALLKISATKLTPIVFGNSDNVKVGEWVLAVGNPLNLNSTVTAGIISAKARNINIIEGTRDGYAVESFIQTDAAVNMGNSGGALVNAAGELIGINAAIESGTGYYSGYSFAIPVNIVKKVIADLRDYGEVQRAVLGVSLKEINADFAKQNNLSVLKGAYVAGLSQNSNAAKSGIEVGDVITKIDDKNINSTSELIEKISQQHPGDKVAVTVNRSGATKTFNVTLTSKDDINGTNFAAKGGNFNNLLGASLSNPTAQELSKYNVSSGVLVENVGNGVLKEAGIKKGFMITKVDRVTIRSVEQLTELLNSKSGGVLVEGKYENGMKAYYGFGL